jgi:hypothetical protein
MSQVASTISVLPDAQTLIEAGRLIQWALRPHARPAMEEEYQRLIERYRDQVAFRECVQAICHGLGIAVTAVGQRGVVLTPDDDSVFAMTAEDYRRSGSAEDRLIDGFILVGILTTFYPQAQDLEEDPLLARPPVTVEEVERTLRMICERLEEAARAQPDPTVQEVTARLDEAWRAYQNRVATKTTSDGRASAGTTLQMIRRAFGTLQQHGCVSIVSRNGKEAYQPTWKYQVLTQEESVARLASIVRMLVATREA